MAIDMLETSERRNRQKEPGKGEGRHMFMELKNYYYTH